MASVNKNFAVEKGLEVGDSALFVDADTNNTGVGKTDAQYTLDVSGTGNFDGTLAAGSVGIGSTQPVRNLDVRGDAQLYGELYDLNDVSGTTGQVLQAVTGTGVSWTSIAEIQVNAAGTDFQIQYKRTDGNFGGANQFYYNDTTNRVGIGTSAPEFLLQVARPRDDSANGFVQIGGTFLDSDGTVGAASSVLIADADGELHWSGVPAVLDGQIQYSSDGIMDGASDFHYDNVNDRVGIGTTQPEYKLEVKGTVGIAGTFHDVNDTVGVAGSVLGVDVDGNLRWTISGAAGTTGQVQYMSEGGDLAGATNLIYDEINDRVGIGTLLPEYLFQVGGDGAQVQIGGTFRDSNDTVGFAGSSLIADADGELVWSSGSAPPEFNVIFVTEDGNDGNDGTTVNKSKRTIGAACSVAVAGNIIRVTAGVYNEDNPVSVPRNVTIDGDDLRNTQIIGTNIGVDLFHVDNGTLLQNMSFVGAANTGAMIAFHPPRENIHTNVSIATSALYVDSWVGTALTPTSVTYHAPSGVTTFTLASHGLTAGVETIGITTGSLGFTCLSDNNNRVYNHPRATDPVAGIFTAIVSNTADTFTINTGNAGIGTEYVGFITQSPYVRNCTNFVPDSIGMKIDGNDAANLKSMVVDSYTQYNQGGIGVSITNNGYAQLVSIFTICDKVAIYCGSGGQCDLTNSNSSFGDRGLVASGVGTVAYTASLAEAAEFENDTIVVSGLGTNRPFTGQVLYIGELFDQVSSVTVTNPGSGYTSANPPIVTIGDPTGPNGITAEGIAVVSGFGSITSVDLISNGNQYRTEPSVTIADPTSGITATATAEVSPLYFTINSATPPSAGISTIVLDQLLPSNIGVGSTVPFAKQSLILASSHSFEYVGSGMTIGRALPQQGGVAVPANSVVSEDGGLVVHTSTDEKGNFTIGAGFIINQQTGTISGDSFNKSIQATLTPLIIALGS